MDPGRIDVSDNNNYANMSYDEKVEAAKKDFINAVINGETEVDFKKYGFLYEDMYDVYNRIRYTAPQYFACFKNKAVHYTTNPSSFTKISWEYIDGVDPIERINSINSSIDQIAINIDTSWSDFEKALWITNWMFHSVQYDEDLLLRNSYDFFNSSKAVCEGYVDVFYMLGNKCGLDVSYVSSQSKHHVWNAVKIDGEWYNIDMTINIRERTPYRVFLMSDARYENLTNGNVGEHRLYTCDNTQYDKMFWTKNNALGSMLVLNNELYIATDYAVKKFNTSTMMLQTYINKKTPTEVWKDENGFSIRGEGYIDIAKYKDGFLYSTKSEIVYYNLKTGSKTSVYKNTNGPDIYGVYCLNNKIYIKTYADFTTNNFKTLELQTT